MKKFKSLLLIAAFSLIALGAEAKVLQFEVMGGYNNANYSIDGVDSSNGSGWQVGVGLTSSLMLVNAAAEINYISNKFDMETTSVKTQTVEVPVLVGISIFGPLKVEVGPRFSLYNSADATTEMGEKIDLGALNTSTGYCAGLKLSIGKIVAKARYNGNFGKKAASITGVETSSVKYNSYSLSLGIRL